MSNSCNSVGEGQREGTQIRLPDLNVDIREASNNLSIDLNNEPPEEDSSFVFSPDFPDLNIEPPEDDFVFTHSSAFASDDFHVDLNSDSAIEVDTHMEGLEELSSNSDIGDDNSANPDFVPHSKQSRNLSNDERRAIYDTLLQKSVDGKLKKGLIKEVASQFSVSTKTVQRFWRFIKDNGVHDGVLTQKRMGKCGRKRIQIDFALFREIPLHQRTTLRGLSHALNVDKTTLCRRRKMGDMRRHSNGIKPSLKEENKRERLRFCISMLDAASIPHDPIFKEMHNIVHIDEKWFYMSKKSENYYLLPDEEDPLRTCKSKNFITKVMFLVALARPRFDRHGNELFSGKIGVFPFVTQEPAKRTSVNRVAGTLETKPITSVTREVMRSYLIDKVLPAIKEKWPREDIGHPIFIQQDNARVHINDSDEEFRQVATQDGFDIRLMRQPPNSPDLNVLDLGFFSALQSLQYKESPRSVDELIHAVVKSYENFSLVKSNYIFLTLQSCMVEIMKSKGCHGYKTPHMKKAMLDRNQQLPRQIKCDPVLVQEILNYLS